MNAKIALAAATALVCSGLLGACGPHNTLAIRGGGADGDDRVKALEQKLAESDARLAELQQKVDTLEASPAQAGKPGVPRGSALGTGFSRPAGTAAASEAGTAAPAARAPAGPPPLGPKPSPNPKPLPEPRPRHGRVGPAEPVTPEAAMAADRTVSPAPQAPPAPVAASPSPAAGPAVTAPVPASVSAGVAAAAPAEKAEYNQALQLAINGRTAEAKAAFDAFMAAHPQSPLTPDALYWVGEGAYQGGDYRSAINDFDRVAKGWPGHAKAADAVYKMALAQEKAGDTAGARATLERYLKDYPNAELAGAVRQKLQALPK